jgi:hypothetical protein
MSDYAVDLKTSELRLLTKQWKDFQQLRLASEQRGFPSCVEALQQQEDTLAKAINKALRHHPIWPWLKQFPGVGGIQTARLLAEIRDPRRFPGQPCTNGHLLPSIYGVGDPCPIEVWLEGELAVDGGHVKGKCSGTMLTPRTNGNGTRSLWHYCRLHTVDGKSPRKQRGRKCDWNLAASSALLMPDVGIAAQIVRHGPQPYRQLYDETKARKLAADMKPIAAEHIARKVAVKAFVADLLQAWKKVV